MMKVSAVTSSLYLRTHNSKKIKPLHHQTMSFFLRLPTGAQKKTFFRFRVSVWRQKRHCAAKRPYKELERKSVWKDRTSSRARKGGPHNGAPWPLARWDASSIRFSTFHGTPGLRGMKTTRPPGIPGESTLILQQKNTKRIYKQ